MTTEELLALDQVDRAERRLREVLRSFDGTTEAWTRLAETVHDDAFEVGLENLLGPDLPTDAYWDDLEQNIDQPLGPGGGPVWWTSVIWRKHDPERHPFWQGRYAFASTPKASKKKKTLAWTSRPPMYIDGGPQDRPSPAKIAASPERTKASADAIFKKREAFTLEQIRRDDERTLEELLLIGAL